MRNIRGQVTTVDGEGIGECVQGSQVTPSTDAALRCWIECTPTMQRKRCMAHTCMCCSCFIHEPFFHGCLFRRMPCTSRCENPLHVPTVRRDREVKWRFASAAFYIALNVRCTQGCCVQGRCESHPEPRAIVHGCILRTTASFPMERLSHHVLILSTQPTFHSMHAWLFVCTLVRFQIPNPDANPWIRCTRWVETHVKTLEGPFHSRMDHPSLRSFDVLGSGSPRGEQPAYGVVRFPTGRLAEGPYADEDRAMPRPDGSRRSLPPTFPSGSTGKRREDRNQQSRT